MKRLLALCLVVYFFGEVSAKPLPQSLDQARDFFDKLKEKAQDALDQAQEVALRAVETARTAMQNAVQSAQQFAQNKSEPIKDSTNGETTVKENDTAP